MPRPVPRPIVREWPQVERMTRVDKVSPRVAIVVKTLRGDGSVRTAQINAEANDEPKVFRKGFSNPVVSKVEGSAKEQRPNILNILRKMNEILISEKQVGLNKL